MESAFYYETKEKANVDKLLEEDFFKRLGPTDRDAKLMGNKRESGFYLYVNAASEEKFSEAMKRIEESKIPFVKLSGEEEKMVFDAIKQEEEESASGMGAIFG